MPVRGLLLDRDATAARPFILWGTTPVIIGLSIVLAPQVTDGESLILLMGVSSLTFVGMAGVARLVLPRIWTAPGMCSRCGYDIRASVPFHRCPECGNPLDEIGLTQAAAGDKALPKSRAWYRRLWGLALRRPALPVLLVIAALLGHGFLQDWRRQALVRAISSAIAEAAAADSIFDLTTAAPFSWEKVYIFGAYATRQHVERAIGFRSQELSEILEFVDESEYLLVFVRGDQVARLALLNRSTRDRGNSGKRTWFDFGASSCGRAIPRDQARFRIEKDDSRLIIRLEADE